MANEPEIGQLWRRVKVAADQLGVSPLTVIEMLTSRAVIASYDDEEDQPCHPRP